MLIHLRLRATMYLALCVACSFSLRADGQTSPEALKFVMVSEAYEIVEAYSDAEPKKKLLLGCCGVLIANTDTEVIVRDMETNTIMTYPKQHVTWTYRHIEKKAVPERDPRTGRIVRFRDEEVDYGMKVARLDTPDVTEINEQSLIARGPERYLACRVLLASPAGASPGSIIRIDGGTIYVSLGGRNGITLGQELTVYRGVEELTDPSTGEVLGSQRRKMARLEVTEVQAKYCKSRVGGNFEVTLAVGDVVEPEAGKYSIAVLGLQAIGQVRADFQERVREEWTTALVKAKVPVVERRIQDKVVNQLAIEAGEAFDPEYTRSVGKQLAATYFVSGTIAPVFQSRNGKEELRAYRINARLIKAETGEIVFAFGYDAKPQ